MENLFAPSRNNRSIWVSMSVCFDEMNKFYEHKTLYIWDAVMATKLWKVFRPDVKVFIVVIRNK